jgi:hypothetical protein
VTRLAYIEVGVDGAQCSQRSRQQRRSDVRAPLHPHAVPVSARCFVKRASPPIGTNVFTRRSTPARTPPMMPP